MTNNLAKDIFDWKHSAFSAIGTDTRGNLTNSHLMILVSNIILQLGIPANIKGYIYLREAIFIKVNEPQADFLVTKFLYPDIAKKFHTSAISVERAIRHAIEAAWNSEDSSYRDEIFPYAFSHRGRRPTNSEFIALVADRIILLYYFDDCR